MRPRTNCLSLALFRTFLGVLVIGMIATGARAATYVITPDGTGDYPTIQAAIVAAGGGDVIALTDGTFLGEGNRDIDFLGKALTVRSQSGQPGACLLDCQGSAGDPHRGFHFQSNETPAATVERITILNGYAGSPNNVGGGILCRAGAAPTIRDCIVRDNTAQTGGGVGCLQADPTLEGCEVLGNTATGAGGGLSCFQSNVDLTECWLANNTASTGGGLALNDAVCMTDGCTLLENAATTGGALFANSASTAVMLSCTLTENGAEVGGGLYADGTSALDLQNTMVVFSYPGTAVECGAGAEVSLTCCDIYGNHEGDWVGCIADFEDSDGNISADPLFCGEQNPSAPLSISSASACAATENAVCGRIGAHPVGCQGILVRPDGTGDYATIQEAIDAVAAGSVIHLGPGTFSGPGNCGLDYAGKDLTICSQYQDPGGCVIDCEMGGRGGHFHSGEGPSAKLCQVMIRGGHAEYGGAILCEGASPTIEGCLLVDNHATRGGAVCVLAGAPTLRTSTLDQNGAGEGGGVWCDAGAAVTMERTIVSFGAEGGAVACEEGAIVEVWCCDFYQNAGGDWVGCIEDQLGTDGNISEDPLYCSEGNYALAETSPCRPYSAPNWMCPRIGALAVGCWAEAILVAAGGGETAYATIQAAVDAAAEGDVIELTNGFFEGEGNREIDLYPPAPTIRARHGKPDGCIIDCDEEPAFTLHPGIGRETALENLTVRNGYETVTATGSEAGIRGCVFEGCTHYVVSGEGSSLLIESCEFRGNHGHAVEGGGDSLLIEDCLFADNTGIFAAAILLEGGTVESCTFENNLASHSASVQMEGGTMRSSIFRNHATAHSVITLYGGSCLVEDCEFEDNQVVDDGLALLVRCEEFPDTEIRMLNCTFRNNQLQGAEAWLLESVGDGLDLEGCTFVDNDIYGDQAAVCRFSHGQPSVEGCTFYGNRTLSGESPLILGVGGAAIALENTILAFNEGMAVRCDGSPAPPAIFTAACCDIFGNTGGDWVDCIENQLGLAGNIALDPLFCDAGAGDLRLMDESPCAPFSPPNQECDLIGAHEVGCGMSAIPVDGQVREAGDGDVWEAGDGVSRLQLLQCRPNPFAGDTTFRFAIPGSAAGAKLRLAVYDVAGRMLGTIISRTANEGRFEVRWDGRDAGGRMLPAGAYLYRLEVGETALTRRLLRLR